MINYSEFCVCPKCRCDLQEIESDLICNPCQLRFSINDGIPNFTPSYQQSIQVRYLQNAENIAKDSLQDNLEERPEYRHQMFLKFIGNKANNKKVLDIGSSNGVFLNQLNADIKVAFDLSPTFLHAISKDDSIICIQGDAEELPFRPGFFDVIILSDVLEHILSPEKTLDCLLKICTPETRIFVHIPWEEDITVYKDAKYEFVHLRRFNSFSFCDLWKEFRIVRSRKTYPHMKYPLIFQMEDWLPRPLFNRLTKAYFFGSGAWQKDLAWRNSRTRKLPKGERFLLWFFKPLFKMYEMRLRVDKKVYSGNWFSTMIKKAKKRVAAFQ